MALGDVMKVVLSGTNGNEPWMSGFGLIEGSGAPGGPNPLQDCADHVAAALFPGLLEGFSNQLTVDELIVQDVQPGTRAAYRVGVNEMGDMGVNSVPPMCAIVISWQTALRGPANRGRMFLPGLPEDQANTGYWMGGGQAAASAFASKIFDPYGADGTDYQLNVLSYVPDSSPRTLRAAIPVVSFVIGNRIKVQRRRGVGVRIGRSRSTP